MQQGNTENLTYLKLASCRCSATVKKTQTLFANYNKRKNMKKLTAIALFTCLLTAPTAFAGDDSDEVVYSTEGYCLLSNEGVSNDYLNAYARKLGTKPSMKVCNSFREIVSESRPKEWDYPGGRPYPGSVIRLSASQIEMLKALNKTQK